MWHCTLPYNWLPVPHSPTLHISSFPDHMMMQQMVFNTQWPGSSIPWTIVIYSERSWIQFPSWSEFFYVLTISLPNNRHFCLAVQEKFGLSVVNKTLESALSLAMKAVSLLHGKQMMVHLWKVLLVFLQDNQQLYHLHSEPREKQLGNRHWDIWHCTKPSYCLFRPNKFVYYNNYY